MAKSEVKMPVQIKNSITKTNYSCPIGKLHLKLTLLLAIITSLGIIIKTMENVTKLFINCMDLLQIIIIQKIIKI